jgi:hypothetical protein
VRELLGKVVSKVEEEDGKERKGKERTQAMDQLIVAFPILFAACDSYLHSSGGKNARRKGLLASLRRGRREREGKKERKRRSWPPFNAWTREDVESIFIAVVNSWLAASTGVESKVSRICFDEHELSGTKRRSSRVRTGAIPASLCHS